jgi:hypothetical protein
MPSRVLAFGSRPIKRLKRSEDVGLAFVPTNLCLKARIPLERMDGRHIVVSYRGPAAHEMSHIEITKKVACSLALLPQKAERDVGTPAIWGVIDSGGRGVVRDGPRRNP